MEQILTIHTDGGARGNPGPAATGVVIEGFAGKERLICGNYLGETTNNVAEYSAVVLAYETVLRETNPEKTKLKFYTDSLLVVNQLNGKFRVKNSRLEELIRKIKAFEKHFLQVSYDHVPRERNKLADQKVNQILDQKDHF